MGEQNDPFVANELMEIDRTLGCLGLEVWGNRSQTEAAELISRLANMPHERDEQWHRKQSRGKEDDAEGMIIEDFSFYLHCSFTDSKKDCRSSRDVVLTELLLVLLPFCCKVSSII